MITPFWVYLTNPLIIGPLSLEIYYSTFDFRNQIMTLGSRNYLMMLQILSCHILEKLIQKYVICPCPTLLFSHFESLFSLNPLCINNLFLIYFITVFFTFISCKNLIVLNVNDMGQVPVNIDQTVQILFELRCIQYKVKAFGGEGGVNLD